MKTKKLDRQELLELSRPLVKKSKEEWNRWVKYVDWSLGSEFEGKDVLAAIEIMQSVLREKRRIDIVASIETVVRKYVGLEGESGHQDKARNQFLRHVFKDYISPFIIRKRRTAIISLAMHHQIFLDNPKDSYNDQNVYDFE